MNDNSANSKKSMTPANACIPLLLASLCFGYIPEAPAQEAESERIYVTNYAAFVAHTQQHIANVQRLGRFAYFNWAAEFSNLPPELLNSYLEIHDLAKTAGVETLKMFGYKGDKSLGQLLYQYYGRNLNALPEEEKIKFKEIINEVNRIDHNIRMHFFKAKGLIYSNGEQSPLLKTLLKIETLADVTDRSANPVSEEEFNKEMIRARNFLKDPDDRKKAAVLEAYYLRIIENRFIINNCARIHLK